MSKIAENYRQLALAVGLQFDEQQNVLYGEKNGYPLVVYAADSQYPNLLTINMAVKAPAGQTLTKEEIKTVCKEHKGVTVMKHDNYLFSMTVKASANQEKLKEYLSEALNVAGNFLTSKGYEACCQLCADTVKTTPYQVNGVNLLICEACAVKLRQDSTIKKQQNQQKKENLVGGIVGALLGSVLGILCIILCSQMGRVAVLSGVVMAVCTLKGYELLGGKLSKKGIVISILMMLVMTYIGDRIDWAIMVFREVGADWEIGFFDAYQLIPVLVEEEMIESSNYWYNIVLLYMFTIVGVIPTVRSTLREKKVQGQVVQIGTDNTQSAQIS